MLQYRALVDAALDVIAIDAAHIIRHVAAAMGDADFKSGKAFQHAVVHQRRDRHGLLERLPDAVPEMIALETGVAIAAGMNEDDGAELFRLGPERPQLRVAELHRSGRGRDGRT